MPAHPKRRMWHRKTFTGVGWHPGKRKVQPWPCAAWRIGVGDLGFFGALSDFSPKGGLPARLLIQECQNVIAYRLR